MACDFDNERPIYLQIVDQIKIDIASQKYLPGSKIPSVREYALKAQVNPNTMQKALVELERQNLIYTERTTGKYITKDIEVIKNLRHNLITSKINNFISSMQEIGVSKKELINYIKENERNNQ